jgi:hypothetical protein
VSSRPGCVDVRQAHLAAGDELVVVWTADLDLPELLRWSLLDRDSENVQPAGPVRTQEVRCIRDADRMLTATLDGLECARGGERLDHRRVQATMDEAPRLVMALVGGDRAAHARHGDLLELDVEQLHQLAGLSGRHAGVKFWRRSASA